MKVISKFGIVLVAISIWANTMSSTTWAQSGISSSCTNVLVTLSPCLNYITGNSTSPSTSCCTQLATVVKSSPECLCEVVNSGGGGSMAAGLNINQTQALYLPNACNVKTPSITSCTKAPASSPAGTSTTTTTPTSTTPSSISTGGSKTTPTTQGESSSEASKSRLHHCALVITFLVSAFYALTIFSLV